MAYTSRNALLLILLLLNGVVAIAGDQLEVFPPVTSSPDSVVSPDFVPALDSLTPDFTGNHLADLDRYFSSLANGSPFELAGSLSIGADWGLTQDLNSAQSIGLRYWTQGDIQTEVLGVPVRVTGQYFQQAIRPETQNFIRITYDREAFKLKSDELNASKLGLVQEQRFQIMNRLQDIDMQSSYLSTLDMYPQGTMEFPQLPADEIAVPSLELPSTPEIPEVLPDSMIAFQEPGIEYPRSVPTQITDSLRADQVRLDLQAQRQSLQDSLERLNQYEAGLKQLANKKSISGETLKGAKKWLDEIDEFQLGQVIPVFSTFIVAPQPVNGVYARYSSSSRDIAVLHGQVMADMRPPEDRRMAWLQQITSEVIPVGTNLGDRVTAGMISVWKRDDNFLRFNVMSGIDKWNENPADARPNAAPFGRNAAAEIEGMMQIASGHTLEAAYAYSTSVNTERLHTDMDSSGNNQSIANSAARVKWNGAWTKAGITASAEGRVIGGNFRSLSNPFLREDQGAYQLRVAKRWKHGELELARKFRQNNISGIAPATSTLSQWMLKYDQKIGKKWKLGALIAPMDVNVVDRQEAKMSELKGRQVMAIATRITRVGKLVHLCQLVYTDMQLNDDVTSIRNEMKELMADYRIISENGWTINPSAMSSIYIGMDSAEMNRLLRGSLSVSKTLGSGGLIEGGGSWLVQSQEKPQPGYRASLSKSWKNGLSAAVISEKVAMENFFSSEILDLYRNNPYRCQAKLTLTF